MRVQYILSMISLSTLREPVRLRRSVRDLKDEEALLGVENVGEDVLLHLEDGVFELLGKFALLVDAEEAALLGGAAVGKALGDFAEIFAIFNALESGFGFLFEVRKLGVFLPFRADFDFAESDLFWADEFSFCARRSTSGRLPC